MRKPIITDEELVQQYLAGNEACLKMLINRHQEQLFTSIYMLTKDRYLAEDIFQDTFIKIIKTLKRGKYTEQGKFLPWASRIARNLVIDHFRKLKKMPVITTEEGFDIFSVLEIAEDNREDEMVQEQTNDTLRKLIRELPEEQREVLILRHYADMPFKEIAELTGVSINTALGRMRYALTNLRKMIDRRKIRL